MGGFIIGQKDIYQCKDCGFEFEQDYLNFFLNLKTGQIEDFMVLMFTVGMDRNSPLTGIISKTYCGNCNKYIRTYEIEYLSENYDVEAAYYLLRLLLPKKLDNAKEKVRILKKFDKIVKKQDLDLINNFINSYGDYLENICPIETLDEIEDMDIEYYLEDSIEDLERLKSTVFSIHLPNAEYNINLKGEKLSKDICPNCKSTVYEINYENPCPKCGGEWENIISMMMD